MERRASMSGGSSARIPKRTNADSAPLSFSQQLIWLATQLDKSTASFNRLSVMRVIGRLEHAILQRALSTIVERHEALRSRIVTENGAPRAYLLATDTIPLPVTDLSELSVESRRERVKEMLDAEARKSFDLDTGPWLRAGILAEGDDASTLYITTHHIASDGWSDSVMFSELHALYDAYLAGERSPLADLPIQFGDYAAWQRERAEGSDGRHNAAYWRNRLAGAPVKQDLPADFTRPEVVSNAGAQVTRLVRSEVVDALGVIGRQEGATPAMTSLAAFMLLQSRLTGQSDTVVGLSIAGRTHPEVEAMIGVFSGVLPLRVAVHREMSFRELVREVRASVLEAHEHQLVSVEEILESLPAAQSALQPEIAQTLFNYRNMPAFPASLRGLEVHGVQRFNGSCLTDLDLEVVERDDGWKCDLRFRTDLYEPTTAERLLGHYLTLLESIAMNPDELVGRLHLLTPSERHEILVDFNGPVRALPPVLRIDDMFAQQARRTPLAIAVSSETGDLTYAELEHHSNAFARDLRARGVGQGSFVGVCMERSVEMVVSLMAILKCGGAFVPLDPEYPSARLSHMVADTRPVLVLADGKGLSLLGTSGSELLLIDRAYIEQLEPAEAPPPRDDDAAAAVACVLYTSGSTGLPKGVLSTHRGIANNLLGMQETFALSANDCMLQNTSIGFDAAAWEIFWPLSVGARTHLARTGDQRDAEYLAYAIERYAIGIVCFAPSMLNVLLDVPGFTANAQLRVICIGEVLSPALQRKFFTLMPHARLYNYYGPSETSITVTGWTCERDDRRRTVPIGRAMTNTEVYVLDAGREPVPIGVAGEIYVGGVSVSNGYHNRPELTAERFPPHPFRSESGDRVYRSGDIARFGPDGVIEYLGRRDHQLKIRGVRVELEEIEAALNRLPAVRESVVVARADAVGDYSLVAYVVADNGAGSTIDLRRALENQLPPQFVPSVIIPLEELPLGPNGKIDRASLPDPSAFPQPSAAPPEKPISDVEKRLASIWSDLLAVRDVSVGDSFFHLGGHSLLAVRMLQRVINEFGQSISLRTFYSEPTIRALATLLSRDTSGQIATNRWQILKVRDKDAWPPLFYFNGQPASGGRYVHRLPPYLPDDQGFYVVPLPIFDSPITVEEIAGEVIELIRAERPTGPYLLGGNCFGATLALEIAQQLQASGERVPVVVLIHPDALAPTHPWYRLLRRLALMSGVPEQFHYAEFSSAVEHTLRTTREIWRAQRQLSSRERLDRVGRAGQWMASFVRRTAGKGIARRYQNAQSKARARNERVPMPDEIMTGDQTADSELAAHRRYVEEAWIRYTLRPYTGKVAIVWPVGGPSNPPWDPKALWKQLTPNFDWRDVPGNHWTMLHHDLEHSARALGDFIERARES